MDTTDEYLYTYDANYNKTKELYQVRLSGAWVNSSQSTYTYDNNNRELSETDLRFDIYADTTISGDSTRYYFNGSTGINHLTADNGK